ncbi:hypothetical protein, conserved [Trypanosoma brucei gambiense DAL972]|uniref:Phytochelatin synthase n=1 Tax=Trypanosoma brucei gambiense (strain MHOM/CI/86/DAL972) TaxID=679716 RepID=D0A3F9_TRYB9|nr:hypothetical protein, conserved [Trypanosoma brucei gambiense DAL972]CBH15803.1 hypothetical protein, conserved [Trypanosoma brucei gambiense DAL972]|eukprot:XP_011778067.1 hypothetical protein, conserved [Trypanosoma brucei gambiense DAL972]
MGNGQINARASTEEHLRKWEAALAALEKVSNSGRRAMERDRVYYGGAEDARSGNEEVLEGSMRGACRSSQVSFSTTAGGSESSCTEHQPPRRQNQTPNENNGRSWGTNQSGNTSNINNAEQSRTGSLVGQHRSRQQVVEIRKARMAFFKSYEMQRDYEHKAIMECGHFGAAAVALSYLLGGARGCRDRKKCVTMEDIFFAVHLPLHYLHSGVQTLQVMSDILREFIDVDNRFKNEYGLSVVHFDISPVVGQVELGRNEVGDRQTCMQLHEFTKAIANDSEEQIQAVRIVNYDPYVLQQETFVDNFVDGDDDVSALADSIRVGLRDQERQYSKNNNGVYAVIVEVRCVVELMVTLAEGIVDDQLHVRLFEVPAAALFKAMTVPLENERARGFMRIFRKDSVPVMSHDEVQSMFSPELAGGNVLGTTSMGTHASAISGHTSPHIIAVAWAMHLLGGDRASAHGHGNGLPVSDIVRTMKFPAEVLIDSTLPLGEVFKYAREYIRLTERNYDVSIYPILTNTSREDAVPTISVFELESILTDVKNANKDPDAPEHVMVIMYNANVAHNVLYVSNTPQWCVLSGYDEESQVVSLIDAHPKKFMKLWTCSLERLHRAMTSNGYLIFSKRTAASTHVGLSHDETWCDSLPLGHESQVPRVGALRRVDPTVQRYLALLRDQDALGVTRREVMRTLCFPSLPLSPTMIALTLMELGCPTTFEDVIVALPFEISSLMLRYFTLESMAVCLTTYVEHVGLNVSVKTYHTDRRNGNKARVTVEEFEQIMEECLADRGKALVMLFNTNEIEVFGDSRPFGSTGLVVGYNKATGGVTVMDTNPNRYFRTWSVCLHTLFRAMHDADTVHHRCGFLKVSHCTTLPAPSFPLEYSRETPLRMLPLRNIFHVSPSPHFQALSCAFTQLGFFYSPEEIFYEAYLQTMNRQRRRGTQAFAWRDVDVSLSVINKQIDTVFLAQICRMFLESRNSTRGSSDSQIDEHNDEEWLVHVEVMEDVTEGNIDSILRDATRRENNNTVLLLNYDTAIAHDVVGFGRSAALIKAYNPDTKSVLLWEAEHTVFGMFWTVDVPKFIEIGNLMDKGRSPYGLVKFEKVKRKLSGRRTLIKHLDAHEGGSPSKGFDDVPSGPMALRRNREMMTRFLFSPQESPDRRR